MDNKTSIYATWLLNNSTDIELVNAIQSGVSCFCSLIILFKVLDFNGMFKSVQKTRAKQRRVKEMKELEKIKKLIENANNRIDVSIEDLLTDDEEEKVEPKNNEIPIARKKKKSNSPV
jgi:acyl-CoA thioesterase